MDSDDGGLLIHSCIAVDDASAEEIARLGEPKLLIVPSALHRLDAPVYREAFPSMAMAAPRAAIAKAQEKVPIDGPCEELVRGGGALAIAMPGVRPMELCYELALSNGRRALVFNDAMMNLPRLPGLSGFLLGLLGSTGFFGATRISRLLLLNDAKAFAAWLRSEADRPGMAVVLVSHGEPIVDDVASRLRSAAERLE